MKTQSIERYDDPTQFEPLLPRESKMGPLLERAHDLTIASARLGSTNAPILSTLRPLLRGMNSYYTNLIEGEHTRPSDIERALHADLSSDEGVQRRQRLALAHIKTEQEVEDALDELMGHGSNLKSAFEMEMVLWLHNRLFDHLDGHDRLLSDGKTEVEPGVLRRKNVSVGRHHAPDHKAVQAFMERWCRFYGQQHRGESRLVGIAASHHRLAWVHPFLDGNGRVARLHTHVALYVAGYTRGLWSPMRGFARSSERYRTLLQAADEHRRGDLDGRGNLSQQALMDWIDYVFDVCLDQVQFMHSMLDTERFVDRISAALTYEENVVKSGVRLTALRPLHYLFTSATALPRADFKAMLGTSDRTASNLVTSLLNRGFLSTTSAYGALSFAVPTHALRFYFPKLWPEAEAEDLSSVQPSTATGWVRVDPDVLKPSPFGLGPSLVKDRQDDEIDPKRKRSAPAAKRGGSKK